MHDKLAREFADKAKVSKKTATRFVSLLYDKGLDADSFQRLMRRLERFIIKQQMPALIDKLTDSQVTNLIDEIIIEDEKRKTNQDGATELQASENIGLWLFADVDNSKTDYVAGDMVTIQIMRVGKWNHPQYGQINIDKKVLTDVQKNFKDNVRGIKIAVDENHEPNHKALGRYSELTLEENNQALFAKIELTKKGAELLNEGAYKYFSPEIVFKKQDEESGKLITNLLIGGAFTNRPFFKAMKPLLASEEMSDDVANRHQTSGNNHSFNQDILIFNTRNSMKTLLELLAKFSEQQKISASEKTELEAAFNSMDEDDRTEEMTSAFNEIVAKFSDEAPAKTQEEIDAENAAANNNGGEGEGKPEDKVETASTVVANEDGTVTMQASELATLKAAASQTSKLIVEARKTVITGKVNEMVFSESNKMAIVLPKNKQAVIDFAVSLSESQTEQFLKIINNLSTVAANELGTGAEGDAPTSKADKEKLEFFEKTMNMSPEEAQAAFAEYQAEQNNA